MAKILIPTALRQYAGKQDAVELSGGTVGEVLGALTSRHEELRRHLYNDEGKLRSFVNVYLNDDALQKVANDMAAQAMKVCVGARPFRESIIGSGRDELRNCIDEQLSKLADPYGLDVSNLVVPNVALSEEVQALLDSITKSRLETEKAEQDRLKAIAQGEASKAEQEAQIRVEQSKVQEEAKQKTILAELTKDQLEAERQVIEAQKNNDLLSAQRDLEIGKARAAAAIEQAKADLANEIALAEMYSTNPNYYQYKMALANASAIKDTDKLVFVQEGFFPQLIFGQNLNPVVPVQNQPTSNQPTSNPSTTSDVAP